MNLRAPAYGPSGRSGRAGPIPFWASRPPPRRAGPCCRGTPIVPPSPSMYVTLLSDVEDILDPEADGITRTFAEIVEREGARATFCVVGERVRQWVDRGRADVIQALARHDVGYHTLRHSVHPTILEYLAGKGWDDGVAAVRAVEGPGVAAVASVFGANASCYGGPGNSWGPQVNQAMAGLSVPAVVYAFTRVPRGDVHRFCGSICYPNGYCMSDGDYHRDREWEQDVSRLSSFLEAARAEGRQWVEVYLGHPSRILHEEFWDGPNFTAGRMPPADQWVTPRRKADADLAKALDRLGSTVRAIKAAAGIELRTIREMNALFASAREEALTATELRGIDAVIDDNLANRMGRWVILPPDLDLSRIRALTRERLSTLRRLRLR
jgi:hypothetical protein